MGVYVIGWLEILSRIGWLEKDRKTQLVSTTLKILPKEKMLVS